jgi:UPF0755 protein
MKRRLAFIMVVLCLAGAAWGAWDLQQPYRGYTDREMVEIPPGTGAPAIVDLLVSHGVIAHRWPFLIRYMIGRSHHRLKAGEYLFDHPMRPIDVYRKMVAGDVFLYSVVIPEGSDRFDIARILAERMAIDPAEFLRRTENTALIHDLDPDAPTLEGYLFPDTYRFARRATLDTIIAAMVARFRHVTQTKLHDEVAPGSGDLHDAVTLASLVEKETPDPAERPVVAGVFVRRLEKHMPLQCDPTVIYAARLADRPIAVIHASDLKFASPFNTYLHGGLPPGPIANPGEISLRAAFHPADGDELYFVSNNHGGHVFAKTLAEHQHNVAVYRRELAAERRQAFAETPPSVPASKRSTKTARTGGAKKSVTQSQQKTDPS